MTKCAVNKIMIKILVLEKILNNLPKVKMPLWIILSEINMEIINKKYKVIIMIKYQINKVWNNFNQKNKMTFNKRLLYMIKKLMIFKILLIVNFKMKTSRF